VTLSDLRSEQVPRWLAPLSVVMLVLLELAVVIRYAPSAAQDASAPITSFSATRARGTLQRLLAGGRPHPVGSSENRVVRDRILAELEKLRFRPEVQRSFVCGRFGRCAFVDNIVAQLPGREGGLGVLLAAHYDSVGAGPGAADDGSGVAVALEIARALSRGPAPRQSVTFLLTDGEEAGLLGAEAFAASELRRSVWVTVNLEARGRSGPSVMFETTGEPRLVALLKRTLERPVTGSLFSAVYRRLPNATDLTVFMASGLSGYNFAFVEGFGSYHTSLDDLSHLSIDSLQHQGDNALALVRALSDSGAEVRARQSAQPVFFDIFALFVASYPRAWTLPLAALSALLMVVGIYAARRRSRLDFRHLMVGLGCVTGALILAALFGLVIQILVVATSGLPGPWIAHPEPLLVSTIGAALTALVTMALLARSRGGSASIVTGLAAVSLLLAVALGIWLPEASQLGLLPALVAGAALATFGLLPRAGGTVLAAATLALQIATFVVWAPLHRLLPDVIGLASIPLIAIVAVMTFAPLLAALCSLTVVMLKRCAVVALAAWSLSGVVACLVPPYAQDAPQRVSFAYQRVDAEPARIIADVPYGELPEAVARAAHFRPMKLPGLWTYAWSPQLLEAPAPAVDLHAPQVERFDEGATSRLVVRSQRGATTLTMCLPASAGGQVHILGQRALGRALGDYRAFTVHGVGREGIALELVGVPRGTEIIVLDESPGLPANGAALARARPAWAVPSQSGDVTLVGRRLKQ
jgi:hypothetical protein